MRIDNASLWGINTDASGNLIENSHQEVATAYAFRSHSGYYGIVNSEESYQNLVRFLFGDVRVDIHLEIEKVSLPVGVEQAIVKGETLEAGYQFEFLATPKGKRWFLTRRQSVEDSPACRSHQNSPVTVRVEKAFIFPACSYRNGQRLMNRRVSLTR